SSDLSANAAREHPFGQPDIRIVISCSSNPASSNNISILSIKLGKYLSDSAIANPQVGKATQAIELRRTADAFSPLEILYIRNKRSICSFFSSVTFPIIKF